MAEPNNYVELSSQNNSNDFNNYVRRLTYSDLTLLHIYIEEKDVESFKNYVIDKHSSNFVMANGRPYNALWANWNNTDYYEKVLKSYNSQNGESLFDVISSSISNAERELKDKETNNKLYYPLIDGEEQLCHNGCYHFKLKYNPNAKLDGEFKIGNLKMGLDFTQYVKDKFSEGFKTISDFAINHDITKEMVGNELQNIAHMKLMDSLKYEVNSAAIDNIYRSKTITSYAYDDDEVKKWSEKNDVQEKLYGKGKCYITDVFLPLNSMSVHRESGIQESDQIMTNDWKTNQFIEATKNAMKQRDTSPITRKAGYGESKYKGYTMNGYDFETYNFEWDLMPRSWEEMNQILQILTVFQCSCISNIDLNDKSNLYWVVPPECEVEIIVTSSDVSEDKRMAMRRMKTYDNYKLYFNKVSAGGKYLKVKLLKTMKVYIKDVEISPLSNNGGVLLSDEGFPMGVKLKVTAMRTQLMSLHNLQDKGNDEANHQIEGDWKGAKNYNPFA